MIAAEGSIVLTWKGLLTPKCFYTAWQHNAKWCEFAGKASHGRNLPPPQTWSSVFIQT